MTFTPAVRPMALACAIVAVGCGGASAPTGQVRADAAGSDSAVVDQGTVDASTEPIEAGAADGRDGAPRAGALGDCMATEAGVCTTVMIAPGYVCGLPAETIDTDYSCPPPVGGFASVCCVLPPNADVCDHGDGQCRTSCPSWEVPFPDGCSNTPSAPVCCATAALTCVRFGGFCLVGAPCSALGPDYVAENVSPSQLDCPEFWRDETCCTKTPSECTQHGGTCIAANATCANGTPFACPGVADAGLLEQICCGGS
jgi:hypothetical protein